MGLQEQYQKLKDLRPEIDERLKHLDFAGIKDLLLWQAGSADFQNLKDKDNQLMILEACSQIWLAEKKELPGAGIDDDIFDGVDSLDSLERKYLRIQFALYRLETPMPKEYLEEAVDGLIADRVSGIALCRILMRETEYREDNLAKLADLLQEKGQTVTALFLLQRGESAYPGSQKILLKMADCWLEAGNPAQACQCLKRIREPGEDIRELLCELEGMI